MVPDTIQLMQLLLLKTLMKLECEKKSRRKSRFSVLQRVVEK